jgi:hypothetical protein
MDVEAEGPTAAMCVPSIMTVESVFGAAPVASIAVMWVMAMAVGCEDEHEFSAMQAAKTRRQKNDRVTDLNT